MVLLEDERSAHLATSSSEGVFSFQGTFKTEESVLKRRYTNGRYLEAIQDRVLVFDGAMGTSLQSLNLNNEDFGGESTFGCNDYLVITSPDVVRQVHRSFLLAGADVIETNTFRANRITLGEYGLQDRVLEINQDAAELAREEADAFSSKGQLRFVAGAIGPTGKLPSADDSDLSDVSYAELVAVFAEQTRGLIAGGSDLILLETSQDILKLKAAIHGVLQSYDQYEIHLPIQAQGTLDTSGQMLLGMYISAALTILQDLGLDVIGLNCSTGPEHMREPIRYLGEYSRLPVSCIPNAGLPLNVDGEAVYPLEPDPFATDMEEFDRNHKVNVVGGCCGTTPEHIQLLRNTLQNMRWLIVRLVPPSWVDAVEQRLRILPQCALRWMSWMDLASRMTPCW